MNIIINPGSKIGESSGEWTNTHKMARKYAYEWFYKPMIEEGFTDIEVIDTKKEIEGRWLFIFKHKITGVEVELEIHGINDIEAYEKDNIFTPRVYWNGSSSSNPQLEQFEKKGFVPVMTYKKLRGNLDE